jgi:hypothetical protein
MIMSDHETITVRILPLGTKQMVGFDTFIAELQAVHGALVRTDKLVSDGRATTRYEIVDLSMNSPARVVLGPQPIDRKNDVRRHVLESFIGGLGEIREGRAPAQFDRPMLEKIREISSSVRKRRARSQIEYKDKVVEINHIFERRIVAILEQTEEMFGSVEGKLEALNLHNKHNVFAVYPIAGAKKVNCHFDEEKREVVKAAIDKFVIVTGMAQYQYRDRFPYKIEVRDIEAIDGVGDAVPRMEELRGIAPDATGDLDSVEFVRQIRDGWR